MYRAQLWSKHGGILASGDETLLIQWVNTPDTFLWLDATDNDPQSEQDFLKKDFNRFTAATTSAQTRDICRKLVSVT